MSENLTTLLMLFTGYSIHRWTVHRDSRWLLWGWMSALLAPFCRVTALIVPLAFLLAIRSQPQLRSLEDRRRISRWAIAMAGASVLLLAVLPTSVLKIYHPVSTLLVAAKTLFSVQGWVSVAQHSVTNLALLMAGSAGLVLLLVLRGTPDELPIRRYLRVLLFGLLLITVAYMQYGSAGPNAPLYSAAQRYMDPGIAASIPLILVLKRKNRFAFAFPLIVVLSLLAVRFYPAGGFKAGQTLASAGLGLGLVDFPSLVARVPRSIAVFLLCSAVPTLLVVLRSKTRWLAVVVMLALSVPLSFDAFQHSVSMSKARENAEPRLWELSETVPPDAEIVIEERDRDDALMNALFSGLFWLPRNHVYVVESSLIQSVRGKPIVQLTKRWLPDRLLHSGTHKWYLRGHSAPAVSSSRLFYDFGENDYSYVFNAPPSDRGQGRWSGEYPVIELDLLPADYLLYLAQQSSPQYGVCAGMTVLNETELGRFTSEDTLIVYKIESERLRPDGRQLLTLRVSPRSNPTGEALWRHGIRLEWIYCKPLLGTHQAPTSEERRPLVGD
jgi:hypothetical protein